MGSEIHSQNIRVYFFPFMAHGHILPTVDMARLFASRGLTSTIVTTPLNAPNFSRTVERTQVQGARIEVRTIKFPSLKAGLPEGCENLDSAKSKVRNPIICSCLINHSHYFVDTIFSSFFMILDHRR